MKDEIRVIEGPDVDGNIVTREYRLVRTIGEGGQGIVYEAIDPEGNRVALKELKSTKAYLHKDGSDTLRLSKEFERQIKAMQKITLAGIEEVVQFRHAGRKPNTEFTKPFIVMSLEQGETLQEKVNAGKKYRSDEARSILETQLRASIGVHEHGKVVHRNVNYRNIIQRDDDSTVLTDLGAIRDLESRATQTLLGDEGAFDCIAPEQISNEKADERTDLYALGKTIYYIMTGEKKERLTQKDLEFIKDKKLASVIYRLTREDPKDRYKSVREALNDLEGRVKEAVEQGGENETGLVPHRERVNELVHAYFRSKNQEISPLRDIETLRIAELKKNRPLTYILNSIAICCGVGAVTAGYLTGNIEGAGIIAYVGIFLAAFGLFSNHHDKSTRIDLEQIQDLQTIQEETDPRLLEHRIQRYKKFSRLQSKDNKPSFSKRRQRIAELRSLDEQIERRLEANPRYKELKTELEINNMNIALKRKIIRPIGLISLIPIAYELWQIISKQGPTSEKYFAIAGIYTAIALIAPSAYLLFSGKERKALKTANRELQKLRSGYSISKPGLVSKAKQYTSTAVSALRSIPYRIEAYRATQELEEPALEAIYPTPKPLREPTSLDQKLTNARYASTRQNQ